MADYIFRLKRGQSTSWTNQNIVLAAGEPGVELDTHRMKVGDGITPWKDLPYTGLSKSEVESLIAESAHLKRIIVNSIEDIDISAVDAHTTIFMIPTITAEAGNIYEEYMVIDGKVEQIGSTKVNLEDYATKESLNNYATKADLKDAKPDWEQSDPEAANYIKNRIAYIDENRKGEKKLIIDTTIQYDIPVILPGVLQNGAQYEIVMDGISYYSSASISDHGSFYFITLGRENVGILIPQEDNALFDDLIFECICIPNQANITSTGFTTQALILKLRPQHSSYGNNISHTIQIYEYGMHYEELNDKQTLSLTFNTDDTLGDNIYFSFCYDQQSPIVLEEGAEYKITINDKDYFCKAKYINDEIDSFELNGLYIGDIYGDTNNPFLFCSNCTDNWGDHGYISIFVDEFGIYEDYSGDFPIICSIIKLKNLNYYKKIDPIFIESVDWNAQENEPGFIKNKPFYEASPDYKNEAQIIFEEKIKVTTTEQTFSSTCDFNNVDKCQLTINDIESPQYDLMSMSEGVLTLTGFGDFDAIFNGGEMVAGFIMATMSMDSEETTLLVITDVPIFLNTFNLPVDFAGSELFVQVKSRINTGIPGKKIDKKFIPEDITIKAQNSLLNNDIKSYYKNANTVEEALKNIVTNDINIETILSFNEMITAIAETENYIFINISKYIGYGSVDQIVCKFNKQTQNIIECLTVPLTSQENLYALESYLCSNNKNTIIAYCEVEGYRTKMVSIDEGQTWSPIITDCFENTSQAIFKYENNLFFCFTNNSIFYSKNAIDWKQLNYLSSIKAHDIIYRNNLWIICGENGKVIISNDFYNWKLINLTETNNITANCTITNSNLGESGQVIYPFQLDNNGYYISTNAGIGTSTSSCVVVFNTDLDIVNLDLIVSGESGYDYGRISAKNSTTDYSKYQSGSHIITYTDVKAGDFINIQYRKDSSGDVGTDSLQFKLDVSSNFENTSLTFTNIIYAEGTFILQSNNGEFYNSKNGIDWQQQDRSNLTNIIYNGFYLGESNNAVLYSFDLKQWNNLFSKDISLCIISSSLYNKFYISCQNYLYGITYINTTNIVQQPELKNLQESIQNIVDKQSEPLNYLLLKDQITQDYYYLEIHNGSIVTYKQYKALQVLVMPNKTIYETNKAIFDPSGMIIVAIDHNGTKTIIDNYNYYQGSLSDLNAPTLGLFDFPIDVSIGNSTLSTVIPLTFADISGLIDFNYMQEDGYYILTDWKQTVNGIYNRQNLIIPASNLIKI